MTARSRFVSTWIAIAAILLSALMPTLSLAFVSAPRATGSGGGDWVEICTSQGASWVKLGVDGQVLAQTSLRPDGAPALAHQCHCPYCLTHAASFALPPAPVTAFSTPPEGVDRWSPAGLPVRTHWVWLGPAVRAPPLAL